MKPDYTLQIEKQGLGHLGLWIALAIAQGIHLVVLIFISRGLDWNKHVNNLNFRDKTIEGDDFYDLWAYNTMLRRMSLRALRRSSNVN